MIRGTLSEICSAVIDCKNRTAPEDPKGTHFAVGTPAMRGNIIDLNEARRINDATFAEWTARLAPEPGDLLFAREAPVGPVVEIPEGISIAPGQRTMLLRVDPSKANNRFLRYYLISPLVQARLHALAHGSTVPHLRLPVIRNFEVELPELNEQQAIAEVLGAFDDKIAANSRLSVRVDQFLAALFARVTEDSSSIRLGEIANVNPETHKPVSGGYLRYIDISSVGQGTFEFPEISQWDDAPSRARRHVQSGDTLWSTVRPNRRSHALNLSDDKLLVGSTGLAILRPREVGFAYLYEATKTPAFTAYLENVAEGSAYPAVRANRFEDAPISWTATPERESFEMTAAPLRRAQHSLNGENLRLASIRDALLPQLMSGKLRVREAEEIVAAAI